MADGSIIETLADGTVIQTMGFFGRTNGPGLALAGTGQPQIVYYHSVKNQETLASLLSDEDKLLRSFVGPRKIEDYERGINRTTLLKLFNYKNIYVSCEHGALVITARMGGDGPPYEN